MRRRPRAGGAQAFGRRTFLRGGAALPPLIAALFAATVAISCDSGEDDPAADAPGPDDDGGGDGDGDGDMDVDGIAGAIASNHGHSCVITQAQLDAAGAVQLTLTSGSGHTHTLDLTMAQVVDIAAGTEIVESSSLDGSGPHSHNVTFN